MSEKNSNSCSFRTSIGGQALIEGILMRGPKKQDAQAEEHTSELQSL